MSLFISNSRRFRYKSGRRQAFAYLGLASGASVLGLMLAWLYVAALPMAFLGRDYPLWLAKNAMITACDLGSVPVFGDSRAVAAVIPTMLPVPVSNLAMSGTTPIETYFAVERALRCKDMPSRVVIAHGAAVFQNDSRFWTEAPLLGFLDFDQLRDIDRNAERLSDANVRGEDAPDGLPPAVRDWLYSIRFPPYYFASLVNGYIGARYWYNKAVFREAESSRGQALFGTSDGSSELADESEMREFRASPLIDYYFTKTLELLKSHNVETYFISMPVNEATYRLLNRRARAGFAAYLRAKTREFPNFHVVGDVVSCWPDTLFGDAAHLNGRGAEAYSREFAGWLLRANAAGEGAAYFPSRCAQSSKDAAE